MTDKELKKLKRAELLQILLTQSKEIDRLKAELDEANAKLADKNILLEKSGSIAEASLSVFHIFEDAQKAADVYLLNVKRKAEELISGMTPENAAEVLKTIAAGEQNSSPGSEADNPQSYNATDNDSPGPFGPDAAKEGRTE